MTAPAAPVPGIGHNHGPAMDARVSWRRHCRSVAHEQLLPPDGVWLVAGTAEERLWWRAARLGGHLTGERFFGAPAR
jgi:hypothetical protein